MGPEIGQVSSGVAVKSVGPLLPSIQFRLIPRSKPSFGTEPPQEHEGRPPGFTSSSKTLHNTNNQLKRHNHSTENRAE